MALYSPAGHALLSVAAAGLESPVLEAQADLAEDLLGLAGTVFAGADAATATRAVAIQVNFQVEAGTEGEVYGSVDRGDRSFGFRGGVLNPMPTVSPRARAIVAALIGDADTDEADWSPAGSLR